MSFLCYFYIKIAVALFQVRYPGEPVPMPKCPYVGKRGE